LAYAHVPIAGGADNAFNIIAGNVTHPGVGVYCISALTFTPHNPQATLGNTGAAHLLVTDLGTGSGACPGGTQITVFTLTITSTGFASEDNDFWLNIN
jgi:hypothetical protein